LWLYRRQAARAVVLDLDDRVLLLQARDPVEPSKGEWWELPGGGVEGGESTAAAAARELFEETGLDRVEVGDCVWRHQARFTFAGFRFDQQEHIHVARWSGRGEASPGAYRPGGLESMEALAFKSVRWWPLADLDSWVRDGGRVIPPWLPTELKRYLDEGPPPGPVDLGVLGDVF
jgi:8-oxo-dGTP pyrophosphatase MutT (NUDIX family)